MQVPPINEKLPDDIRVFEVVRVTKSFNAKSAAWGRRYEYLMPSYAFDGSWGTITHTHLTLNPKP
jgi:tRNA U38,U39,U40 pseudouridine synthase TruA